MGGLLNLGSRPLDGLLNRSIARLSSLGLNGAYFDCNLFYDRELAMVIYNAKIMLVIYCKDVSSDRFLWPTQCLM